jgi:hypothetical protein
MSNLPTDSDGSAWRRPMPRYGSDDAESQAREYLLREAGELVGSADALAKRTPSDLYALARRAMKDGAGEDVVGSILLIGTSRRFVPTVAALVDLLGRPFRPITQFFTQERQTSPAECARRRAFVQWRRHLDAMVSPFENPDGIVSQFQQATESAAFELEVGAARSSADDRRAWLTFAPGLTKDSLSGTDMKRYSILGQPMRYWKSSVPPTVVGTVLRLEFPHLEDAIDTIVDSVVGPLRVNRRHVVLVGPPGLGKDSIVRRAAELTGRPFAEIDLAGMSDNKTLRGTARGWSTATPSLPARLALQHKVPNPLILMSELEKAGGSAWNGEVHPLLLAWTEPSSAKNWHDEGLAIGIDLSAVTMLFTANSISTLSGPLRSRLRIIEAGQIRPEDVDLLLIRAIERFAKAQSIAVDSLPSIDPRGADKLRRLAARGRLNLRIVERVVQAIYGSVSERPGGRAN